MKRLAVSVVTVAASVQLAIAQSGTPPSGKWEVLPSWGELPAGISTWGGPSQASATPDGTIVVFRRSVPAFFVLNPEGKVVKSFGDTMYRVAHGVRVDRDGFIWASDNADNFVQKLSPDGKVLMTLGKPGVAGDNNSREAFDGPADVFVTPAGDIFVADGYRNSRVVQFSKEGTFVRMLGGVKGSEPGQFNVPHSVVVDSRRRILVADAENSRMQVFDPNGNFVEQWTGFPAKPRGSVFIAPDDTLYISHVDSESISVMKDGRIVDSITGIGLRPHGLTMDRSGNLYVTGPLTHQVKKIVRK